MRNIIGSDWVHSRNCVGMAALVTQHECNTNHHILFERLEGSKKASNCLVYIVLVNPHVNGSHTSDNELH